MGDFQILSYNQEKELTIEERRNYYEALRNYLKNIKVSLPEQILTKLREALNKHLIREAIDLIKGYELIVTGRENIPSRPVIYASTHQDYNDHFNAVLSIPDHAIILNTNTVTPLFKFIMGFNGITYVNRSLAEERFKSKLQLMKHVAKGKSIIVFPEGSYNCSPNKLLLPIHTGVIDIARKTGAPIVPMVQEYTYYPDVDDFKKIAKSCHVHFGTPIYVHVEDDLHEKKEQLIEQLATIRYRLLEEKGLFRREDISNMEYRNFLKSRLDTWRSIKVDYNIEKQSIYGYGDEKYLFTHINAVPINDNGTFPVDYTSKKLTI